MAYWPEGSGDGGRVRRRDTASARSGTQGIPNARLVLYEDRAHGGTFADRRFGRDVVAFLKAEDARA